jgi:hypothetical protein
MAIYALDNIGAEITAYLIDTVSPVVRAKSEGLGGGMLRIYMPEAGIRHLESLSEDSDGHVDNDGQCWFGEAPVGQFEVLHNA